MHNTCDVLKLKVRQIPCLCAACVNDSGEECDNSNYTDSWREVTLKPAKGDNMRKHQKRKHPKECVSGNRTNRVSPVEHPSPTEDNDNNSDDECLPDIVIEDENNDVVEDFIDLTNLPQVINDIFVDLTEDTGNGNEETLPPVEEDDIITGIGDGGESIPENNAVANVEHFDAIPLNNYWESILSGVEMSFNSIANEQMLKDLESSLRPLKRRKKDIQFDPSMHFFDAIAAGNIPSDVPKDLIPIWTLGDGNCMGRAVSIGYIGNYSMHLEIRARTVLEGCLNKKYYLHDNCLHRGASALREKCVFARNLC